MTGKQCSHAKLTYTDAGAAGSGSPARTYKLSDSLLPILLNAYKEKPNRFFDNTKHGNNLRVVQEYKRQEFITIVV